MKRAIAWSFLLLANIALLAHSVVPHHHHHHSFAACFQTSHCTDCEEASKPSCDSDRHRQNDQCKTEECQLLREMYLRIDPNKTEVDSSHDHEIQNLVWFLFSIHPMVEINGLEGLPFRQNSCLPLFYTDFAAQSNGWRAPPVC